MMVRKLICFFFFKRHSNAENLVELFLKFRKGPGRLDALICFRRECRPSGLLTPKPLSTDTFNSKF